MIWVGLTFLVTALFIALLGVAFFWDPRKKPVAAKREYSIDPIEAIRAYAEPVRRQEDEDVALALELLADDIHRVKREQKVAEARKLIAAAQAKADAK